MFFASEKGGLQKNGRLRGNCCYATENKRQFKSHAVHKRLFEDVH